MEQTISVEWKPTAADAFIVILLQLCITESKESAAIEMPTNGRRRKQAAPVKPSVVPVKPSEVVDEEGGSSCMQTYYIIIRESAIVFL